MNKSILISIIAATTCTLGTIQAESQTISIQNNETTSPAFISQATTNSAIQLPPRSDLALGRQLDAQHISNTTYDTSNTNPGKIEFTISPPIAVLSGCHITVFTLGDKKRFLRSTNCDNVSIDDEDTITIK